MLPPTLSDVSALESKSFKYQWLRHIGETAFPDYAEQLPRARSNYFGILRLIDDQVRRFVEHLDGRGLRENTILFFLSDHGDYVGEYGLVRKGAELPEVLVRIPFQVCGPGIQASPEPHLAHINIVDILPTICEATGTDMPPGVQGAACGPCSPAPTGRGRSSPAPMPSRASAACTIRRMMITTPTRTASTPRSASTN